MWLEQWQAGRPIQGNHDGDHDHNADETAQQATIPELVILIPSQRRMNLGVIDGVEATSNADDNQRHQTASDHNRRRPVRDTQRQQAVNRISNPRHARQPPENALHHKVMVAFGWRSVGRAFAGIIVVTVDATRRPHQQRRRSKSHQQPAVSYHQSSTVQAVDSSTSHDRQEQVAKPIAQRRAFASETLPGIVAVLIRRGQAAHRCSRQNRIVDDDGYDNRKGNSKHWAANYLQHNLQQIQNPQVKRRGHQRRTECAGLIVGVNAPDPVVNEQDYDDDNHYRQNHVNHILLLSKGSSSLAEHCYSTIFGLFCQFRIY